MSYVFILCNFMQYLGVSFFEIKLSNFNHRWPYYLMYEKVQSLVYCLLYVKFIKKFLKYYRLIAITLKLQMMGQKCDLIT